MKLPFQYDNQTIDTVRHLAGVALLCVLGIAAGTAGSLWVAPQLSGTERQEQIDRARNELGRLRDKVLAQCTVPELDEGERPGRLDVRWPADTPVLPITSCCDPQFDRDSDGYCDDGKAMYDREAWKALGFTPEAPTQFIFNYKRVETPLGQTWKLSATADLACNGELTTLELMGPDPAKGLPEGCWSPSPPQIYRDTDIE